MWVSKALKRALIQCNITVGFRNTGIYPLNPDAVNAHMGFVRQFASPYSNVHEGGPLLRGGSTVQAHVGLTLFGGWSSTDKSHEEAESRSDLESDARKDSGELVLDS